MLARGILALLLALSPLSSALVIRDSHIKLPFVRRFKLSSNTTLPAVDRVRAKALKAASHRSSHVARTGEWPVVATSDGTTYVTEVGIGTPPTAYTLLIDTGSSDTWVGAGKRYVRTVSSQDTNSAMSVSYGSGSFSGKEWSDTVTLGALVINNQPIGVAEEAQGFDGVDGILGIGPTDLTAGTVSGVSTISTVTDTAWAQGSLKEYQVGIGYKPDNDGLPYAGELTFGGIDPEMLAGPLQKVSITSTYPASEYVGIDQSVTYGPTGTNILDPTSGITDTGTTLLLLATDAFKRYQQATGAVLDVTTGLLKIRSSQYDQLQSLFFIIGRTTYEFTKNAQIWPRSLNAQIGGDPDDIYLIISDLGSLSGQGLDFINGYSFLQRFYTVYSTDPAFFGIAESPWTDSASN